MAKLTQDEVLHVAKLANLDLNDDEVAKLTPQLSTIIDFVGELDEVDTKDVEPTSQTTGLTNVTRQDVVSPDNILTQDESVSGTDNIHNGYIKVPAILSERSTK